jgi:hypothetical protein
MDQTTALEIEVVEVCAKHEREHGKDTNYRQVVRVRTEFFVKFGNANSLLPEIASQKYLYDRSTTDHRPGAPRIAQVVHVFKHKWTVYLVMELITLMHTPSDFVAQMAEAIVWLANVPCPPNHVLGPVGGGRIRHEFFQDDEAPLKFTSVMALERYIEKVR